MNYCNFVLETITVLETRQEGAKPEYVMEVQFYDSPTACHYYRGNCSGQY
jgi:hypothetical protein